MEDLDDGGSHGSGGHGGDFCAGGVGMGGVEGDVVALLDEGFVLEFEGEEIPCV